MKTVTSNFILKTLLITFCLFQLMIGSSVAQDIVANAGPDTSYESGSTVMLDGSNSYDNNGLTLTYSWYIAKKPAGSLAVLTTPDSATPEFTVDIEGIYIITLTVINEDNLSAADTVKIQVCPYGVYEGNYTIKNQEDLDALSGYTKVSGNLTIGGDYNINKRTTFKNLDALSCLTSIGGNLFIYGNAELENIDGLKNLKAVSTNDPFIVAFTLSIGHNNKLQNIDGFKNLTSLGVNKSGLAIFNNSLLETISGLRNISNITLISIYENPALLSLNGLENMSDSYYMVINNNDVLADLSALSSITSLGRLVITGNKTITDLHGLENLETISGYLSIINNKVLSNLDALDNLCSVGQELNQWEQSFTITKNPHLCTDKAYTLKDQIANCPSGGLGGTATISDNLMICD